MAEYQPRRRALCVRARPNEAAPPFLHAIANEWVHALSLHCDVTVVEQDFDFRDVCDQVRPDFVVFDAVHFVRPNRVTLTNADAYPEIPRAFYFNCDPHDPLRPQFLEMLSHYRIDTIFCGVEHLKQMPELSQFNCFVIPLFIDADLFRDYGLDRNIPVSIFGGHAYPSFYPWRAKALEEMQRIFPVLVFPHPGYSAEIVSPFEVRDEKYARTLAASRFSLSDTTRMDYVVRKHLEIPAAGAILIAPDSEVLKPMGFVDMENCILGEGMPLYKKIMKVAADPLLYERIRKAGHALIHGRYTRAHWTHIVDWFECRATCGPQEAVQQTGRFAGFRVVPVTPNLSSIDGLHLETNPMADILGPASEAILTGGDLAVTKARLQEACSWVGHVAEPRFLQGIIAMLEGDLDAGITHICQRSGTKFSRTETGRLFQFGQLDPCELAALLLVSAIRNDADLCKPLLDRARATPHVAVRRAIWVISGSPHDIDFGEDGLMTARPGDWPSIHWLGQESFPQWLLLTARMMAANGLDGVADYMRMIADAFAPGDEVEARAA